MMKLDVPELNTLLPDMEMIPGPDGMYAYMFIAGEYEGVSYTYLDIKFDVVDDEDGNDECLNVGFGIDVLSNFKNVDINPDKFKNLAGNILIKIIEAAHEKFIADG